MGLSVVGLAVSMELKDCLVVQSRKGKDGTDVPKLESSRYVRPGLVRGRPGRLLGLLEECGEGEPSSPPNRLSC